MIDFSNSTKEAIIAKDRKISFSEFNTYINKYATLFENNKSERVAIISENRVEWIFAFYSIWKNNKVAVPIDYMASSSDVAFILNDCKPSIIFTSNEKADVVNDIVKNIDYTPVIINLDTVTLPDNISAKEWNVPKNNEDTAVIIYTSGTTGSPKGVMLSFTNLLANVNEVCNEVNIYQTDMQVLMLLPMHHIFPLVGTMVAPLSIGATVVLSPSMQSADLLETLKNNKVGLMVGVPRLYELIYKGLKAKIDASFAGRMFYSILSRFYNKNLSKKIFKKVHEGFGGHLEFMIAGGAALNPEVGKFFKTMGFSILEGYGMTEAAPMITFNRPENFRIGTPGQKLKTVDIQIIDGEITAKGPNIMQGYFNRPKETAEILKDGRLYTGDLGYIDKDGFLYITGRKKEIIVLSNGKNINPTEIEHKLENTSPFISEVAISLINDSLHAFIVPDYSELHKEEIKDIEEYFKNSVISDYNNQASSYKRIMQFTLLKTEIPRTRLGKIQRFKLEQLLLKDNNKSDKNIDNSPECCEEYKSIKVFIEEQTNSKISPDDHLEFDIALDSLGKLSLIDFIDKSFGVKIDEKKLLDFPSVKKLVEFVSENKLKHKIEHINWSSILKEKKINLKLPKTWFTIKLFKNSSKYFFKLYFKFKGKGMENIPEGACIIAPNHQSFLDGLFVASFLKNQVIAETYFYAKKKHVKNKIVQFLARKNNIIVMDITNDLKESIQKLAEVLRQGKKIIIFPEGTRTKDGNLGDFKKMFSILSKEMNVPIVPVAITGAYHALPRGKKVPKLFAKVNVEFLKPVYPDKYDYDSLTKIVKSEIDNASK